MRNARKKEEVLKDTDLVRNILLGMDDESRVKFLYDLGICFDCGRDVHNGSGGRLICHCENDE